MKTIQGRFREMYGFDDSHKCKDCNNLVRIGAGKRNIYKCQKIGIAGSAATDIRLKDPSCKLFEKRNEEEAHK